MMEAEQLIDTIKYLQKSYTRLNNKKLKMLHPIDYALILLDYHIGCKWFSILKRLGITYQTPCTIINSNEIEYYDNTILLISNSCYKIISNREILSNYKFQTAQKIKKNINICFDHKITKETYYTNIL